MRRLFCLVLLVSACTPVYPGESDGDFHLVGELQENSCGETALPAVDPLVFDVELRSDGSGQAFWRRPSSPAVSGTVHEGSYHFRFRSAISVYPGDEVAGTVGCALIQDEIIELATRQPDVGDGGVEGGGDAGAGADDAGAVGPTLLVGTDEVTLTVAPGYDCSATLGSNGGPFIALPCGVRYSLSGSPSEAP